MPYYRRRRTTTYRKKPTYRRRYYGRGKPKSTRSKAKYRTFAQSKKMPGLIVPDRAFCKLKYSSKEVLSSTATGEIVQKLYSGNGMFDPEITDVGSQPLGYDQWSAFYNQYRVYGSKIKVEFICTNASATTQTFEVALLANNDQAVPTSMDDVRASPYSNHTVGNLVNMNKLILRSYWGTAKMLGTNKRAVAVDDTLKAPINANPSNQWYWHILQQPTTSGAVSPLVAYVTVTYYAEFFDRKELTLS